MVQNSRFRIAGTSAPKGQYIPARYEVSGDKIEGGTKSSQDGLKMSD
jgi:hypothetical protein